MTTHRPRLRRSRRLGAAIAAAILFIAPSRSRAGTVTWAVDANGLWSTAADWSGGLLPGVGDDVVISRPQSNVTVTLNTGAQSIHSLISDEQLSITGGSLSLAADSSISGLLSLSGGTLSTSGTLTLGGTANLTGGMVSGSGSLLIPTGGTLNATAGATIQTSSLTNNGAITVQSGTLALPSYSGGGTFSVATGASLDFSSGGTFTNATFTGSGTVHLGGSNSPFSTYFYDVQAPWTAGGQAIVDLGASAHFRQAVNSPIEVDGQATFDGPINANLTVGAVDQLNVGGGFVTLDDQLNGSLTVHCGQTTFAKGYSVVGTMTWTGGSIGGLTVPSGASMNILRTAPQPSPQFPDLPRMSAGPITNNGTLSISGYPMDVLNITNSGLINLLADPGPGTTITNNASGSVVKLGSGTTNLGGTLANAGSISVQAGALNLPSYSGSGTFAVSPGATLYFTNGGTFGNASFPGGGDVHLSGGTFTINAPWNAAGTSHVESAATATFNQPVNSPMQVNGTATFSQAANASITAAGTATFNGSLNGPLNLTGGTTTIAGGIAGTSSVNWSAGNLNWTGGSLNAPGTLVVPTGATLSAMGTLSKTLNMNLTNNGSVVVQDSTVYSGSVTISNNGMFSVSADLGTGYAAIFNNNSGATLIANPLATPALQGPMNNNGSIIVQGTSPINSSSLTLGYYSGTGTVSVAPFSTLSFINSGNFGNGAFTGGGDVHLVGGLFNINAPWNNAGYTVIDDNAQVNFNQPIISTSPILNFGSVSLNGGTAMNLTNNGSVTIQDQAVFTGATIISNNAKLTISSNLAGVQFTNGASATLVKVGSGGATVDGPVSNAGLVSLQGGTLTLTNYSGAGTVSVAPGTTLYLIGTGTVNNGTFPGGGAVHFANAFFSYPPTSYDILAPWHVSGSSFVEQGGNVTFDSEVDSPIAVDGTAKFNQAINSNLTVGELGEQDRLAHVTATELNGALTFNSGTLGMPNYTVVGNMKWFGGQLQSNVTVAGGASVSISGVRSPFPFSLTGNIVNAGDISFGGLAPTINGTLQNNAHLTVNVDLPDVSIYNSATGTIDASNCSFGGMVNDGLISVDSGSVQLSGYGGSGTFVIASKSTLSFTNGGTFDNATFSGAGDVHLASGTFIVNAPWSAIGMSNVDSGATATFNQTVNSEMQVYGGATFNQPIKSPVDVYGVATFDQAVNASVQVYGTATFDQSVNTSAHVVGTANLAGGTVLNVVNDGTVRIPGGLNYSASTITNNAGASFIKVGAGDATIDGIFNNSGSVAVQSGSLTLPTSAFSGNGTFSTAPTATLYFANGGTLGNATFFGGGTIDLFSGTFFVNRPWNVPGTTVVDTSASATFNSSLNSILNVMGTAILKNGGNAAASVSVLANGQMTFDAGADAGTFGSVSVSGGTANVNRSLSTSSLMVSSGQLTLQSGANVTATSLGMSGGTGSVSAGGVLSVTDMQMSGGTLTLSSDSASPGTLLLQGNLAAAGPMSAASITTSPIGAGQTAGTVDLAGGKRTFTIADSSDADDLLVSARIINGTLIKDGPGTLRLTSPDNFFGFLEVHGPVAVDSDAELGSATNPMRLIDGTLRVLGSFSTSRSIVLGDDNGGGNGTIEVSGGNTLSLLSPVGGLTTLNKTGDGTLVLSAGNTYSGSTVVQNGILLFGSGGSIQSSSLVSIASGATLDIGGQNIALGSVSDVKGSGGGSVLLGSGNLSFGSNGAVTSFSGSISGAGSVSKVGPGQSTLSGNNSFGGGLSVNAGILIVSGANSFTGGISLQGGGTLSVSSDTALGDPSNAISFSGGTLAATTGFTTARALTVGPAGAFVQVDAPQTLTATGPVTGAGVLAKRGTGVLAITSSSSFTGTIDVASGTMSLLGSGSLQSASSVSLDNGGTLLLDDRSAGDNPNRISDSAAIMGRGGSLSILGADDSSSFESLGSLSLMQGLSSIEVDAGSGGTVSVGFASLVLSRRASVQFVGESLGTSELVLFTGMNSGELSASVSILEGGKSLSAWYDPLRGVMDEGVYEGIHASLTQSPPMDNSSVPEPGAALMIAVAARGLLGRSRAPAAI